MLFSTAKITTTCTRSTYVGLRKKNPLPEIPLIEEPADEGMPNEPSIFAYLVFSPGGTTTKEITRPVR
jgi:hypothetical protein